MGAPEHDGGSRSGFCCLGLVASFGFILVLSSGCRGAATSRAIEGASSVRFVEPPTRTAQGKASMGSAPRIPADALEPPKPIYPLAMPVYPPSVLGRQTLPEMIGVRLTIDAAGRVTDVSPSLAILSLSGPFTETFRAAIDAAVLEWRFAPAQLQHLVPAVDQQGREFWRVMRMSNVESTVHVVFTFSVKGEVIGGVQR